MKLIKVSQLVDITINGLEIKGGQILSFAITGFFVAIGLYYVISQLCEIVENKNTKTAAYYVNTKATYSYYVYEDRNGEIIKVKTTPNLFKINGQQYHIYFGKKTNNRECIEMNDVYFSLLLLAFAVFFQIFVLCIFKITQ